MPQLSIQKFNLKPFQLNIFPPNLKVYKCGNLLNYIYICIAARKIFVILRHQVTDIQAKGASLSWVAPSQTEGDDEPTEGEEGSAEPSFMYEVSVSYCGKDGKYKSAYR